MIVYKVKLFKSSFANTLRHSPLYMGRKWGLWNSSWNFESRVFYLNFFYFNFSGYFFVLFRNDHSQNVVSTFTNVVKLDVENDNVLSTLSNVVRINVEIHNIDSTLLDVVNFNVEIHNVVSTLVWRCLTLSQTTLKCLLGYCYNRVIKLFWSYQSIINWPSYVILVILV